VGIDVDVDCSAVARLGALAAKVALLSLCLLLLVTDARLLDALYEALQSESFLARLCGKDGAAYVPQLRDALLPITKVRFVCVPYTGTAHPFVCPPPLECSVPVPRHPRYAHCLCRASALFFACRPFGIPGTEWWRRSSSPT
jgi:hypothetical protein